jgi:hypothetical protein
MKYMLNLKMVLICLLTTLFFNQSILHAQTPGTGIFFQAIARDQYTNPAKDRKIYVEASIIQSTATGTKVLIETHQTITDGSGVFSISVGQGKRSGGTVASLDKVEWAKGPYYLNLKIAITPMAPIANWDYTKDWIDLGTSPFGTVPYALYSGSSGALDDKLSVADTSKMLAIYAKSQVVNSLSNQVSTKLSATDTTKMLAPYAKMVSALVASNITSLTASAVNAALDSKVNIADSTTVFVTPFQLASKTFDSTAIYTQLGTKLNKLDTATLSNRINLKANTTDVTSGLALKANTTDVTSGLALKANTTDLTSGLNLKLDASQRGVPGGVASLDINSKIPATQIPVVSFQSANVVASQAAMLGLSTAVVGSIAIRTDSSKNLILSGTDPSIRANWVELAVPTSVTTINGIPGAYVTLTTDEIGEGTNNKYYTDTRVRNAISASGPLNYNAAAGTFSITAASTSSNGYLSASDFTAFNNKQNTLVAGTDYATPSGNITGNAANVTGVVSIVNGGTGTTTATGALTTLGAEPTVNKSTATDLGNVNPSDVLFPSQKAVKTYVDLQNANAGVADLSITNAKLAGSITADKLNGSIPASKLIGTDIATVGTITSGIWSATTIALNKGGTGATTAADARMNLGLVIGTNVMAANAITTLTGDVTGSGNGSFATTVNTIGGVSSATIAGLPTTVAANTSSITAETTRATNAESALDTKITSNTSSITAETTRATNAESALDTRITSNTTSITAETTRATNAESALDTRITSNTSSITAETTRATNAENALDTRITSNTTSITANTTSINNETTRATNAESALDTRITSNTSSITAETTRATNAESALDARITSNTSSITAETTRATNAESALDTRITSNTASITANTNAINTKQSALTAGSGISISGGTISATGLTTSNLTSNAGITNAQLANSATTLGNTTMTLGGTVTSVTGLTSLSATNLTGDLTGNASTATALATGRIISTSGDVTYISGSFDGSANVTGVATLVASGVASGTYGSSTAIPTFTVDSKGRLTAASTVGITAGVSNLNYTTTTSYAVGGTISGTSLTLTAADGNNPGLISTRAQTIAGAKTFSSDITAPNFIGNVTGNLSGNATTATTAGNITATANTTLTSLSALNTVGTITTGVWSGTAIANNKLENSTTTLGSTTMTLGGTVTSVSGLTSLSSTNLTGALTGNASTATALATGRTISTSGDITFTSGNFDGTGDVTGVATLAASGVASGTYGSSTAIPTFTVDSKGRLTAASTVGITAGVSTLNYTTTTSYAAGGTISGTSLTLSAADGTNPGLVSTGTQTIAGAKTFSSNIIGNLSGNATTATTAGNITATSNSTITSLSALSTVGTITAGTWSGSVIGSNVGGAGAVNGLMKANGSGIVSAAVAGSDYQAPITLTTAGNSGVATFTSNTLNIPTYTLAGLGGIGLSGLSATAPLSYNNGTGAFSIPAATSSANGYLTSTDWTTFNNKQTALIAGAGSGISISGGTISATGLTTSNLSSSAAITNAQLAGSIAASKLVGTDIATVGTITSGTWSGSVIGSSVGGAGTVSGLMKANGSGVVSAAVAGTDFQAPYANLTNIGSITNSAGYLKNVGNGTFTYVGSITDTELSTITSAGKVSNTATTATSANTANAIVARDASGNFTAGTITGTLSGTATGLTTGRTISTTGDVTYTSGSFDGTGNVTGVATLAASGVSSATYGSSTSIPVLTVDTKGRVTSASNVSITAGVNTVTAIAGTSNANGATISGTAITLTPADATNGGLLTAGTQTIGGAKTFSATVSASSAIARGVNFAPTLTASANSDILAGIDINPTFNNSIYSSVKNYGLRVQNIGIGTGSGNISTNTTVGNAALGSNTTGNQNTSFGYWSSMSNTTGSKNTSIGSWAQKNNTIGSDNTAVGFQAMQGSGSRNYNTAIGSLSQGASSGTSTNTANTSVGYNSLNAVTSGSENVAIGNSALYGLTTANYNTALGSGAGGVVVSGSTVKTAGDYGIYIGYNAVALAASSANEIVIGSATSAGGYNTGLGTNSTSIGNTSTQQSRIYGALTVTANTAEANATGTSSTIAAQNATTATFGGGNLNLTAGNAGTTGLGGNIVLTPGTSTTAANNGIVRINGQVQITGGSPAAGEVLLSDANGLATWSYSIGSTIVTSTTTYAITLAEAYVFYTGTADGAFTIPDPSSSNAGKEITIKNKTGFVITITPTSTGKIYIDSANTAANNVRIGIEASNNWIKLVSDGSQWNVFRALF